MYCPNCGKLLTGNFSYCPHCGTKLSTGSQGSSQYQQQQQQGNWTFPNININPQGSGSAGNSGSSPIGSNKTLGCIALVASFLIPLVGIVIYFMYRNRDLATAKKMLYASLAGLAFNVLVNLIGMGSHYSYFNGLIST